MNKIIRFLTAALCTIGVIFTCVSPVIPAEAVSEETLAVIRTAAESSGVRLDPAIDAIAVKAVNDIEALDASAAQQIVDALYLAARIDPAAYIAMVNSLVCQANENALLLGGAAAPAPAAPAAAAPVQKAAPAAAVQQAAPAAADPASSQTAAPAQPPVPPIQYIPGIVLNKSMGANPYGPSGKEVYYNMDMTKIVARMKALGYPGEYWVRSDGAKMFGDYVMCAASYDIRPLGSLVESSLGTCIVCDTGGFASHNSHQIDIAVTW